MFIPFVFSHGEGRPNFWNTSGRVVAPEIENDGSKMAGRDRAERPGSKTFEHVLNGFGIVEVELVVLKKEQRDILIQGSARELKIEQEVGLRPTRQLPE